MKRMIKASMTFEEEFVEEPEVILVLSKNKDEIINKLNTLKKQGKLGNVKEIFTSFEYEEISGRVDSYIDRQLDDLEYNDDSSNYEIPSPEWLLTIADDTKRSQAVAVLRNHQMEWTSSDSYFDSSYGNYLPYDETTTQYIDLWMQLDEWGVLISTQEFQDIFNATIGE